MAASASFRRRRRKSVVEPLSSPLQKMDDNPISPGTLPRNIDEIDSAVYFLIRCTVPVGLLICLNLLWFDTRRFWSPVFLPELFLYRDYTRLAFFGETIRPYYRQHPCIASRLQAVIDTNVREMDNLLALMKLWESRSCQKVDGHSTGEDTMTRLGSFLEAMESLDLTNKIYELKGLSSHLNIVTKRLIRSQLLLAVDLILRNLVRDFCLYLVLVSEG